MLDNARARNAIAQSVNPLAKTLLSWKFTPDSITWAGTLGTVFVSVTCISQGRFLLGGILLIVLSLSDLLDGTMARMQQSASSWGAFLDSTLDRVSDAAIIGGVAYYYSNHPEVSELHPTTAALIALVMGMLTSYVRARAEGLGVDCKVGIAERAERSIIILTGLIFTGLGIAILPVTLWVLAALTSVTVLQRIVHVRRLLEL